MRYPKECVLKECEEAIIRPLDTGDAEHLADFYQHIPIEDRWFMSYDVTDSNVVKKRFDGMAAGEITSIIALCCDKIVGQGTLYKQMFGATRHVGRFRILVLPEFRKKRLGTWLLLDLIQLAMDEGLEMLRTDLVVGIESAAIEAVQKFDFFRRSVLKNYVKDINGNRHDLIIMVKRLQQEWSDY